MVKRIPLPESSIPDQRNFGIGRSHAVVKGVLLPFKATFEILHAHSQTVANCLERTLRRTQFVASENEIQLEVFAFSDVVRNTMTIV